MNDQSSRQGMKFTRLETFVNKYLDGIGFSCFEEFHLNSKFK